MVTLALAYDVDALNKNGGLIPADWQKRLPQNSSPYTSTIVFLVRKGNPKQIKDWNDLAKPGVEVITPNPKTSGGARWNYLAAWGYALAQPGGSDAKRTRLGRQDLQEREGARLRARAARPPRSWSAASATCSSPGRTRRSWRMKELGPEKFEIVVPSLSILAEPPVTVVDKVVDKRGTRKVARRISSTSTRPKARRSPARTSTARAIRRLLPSTPSSSST